MTDCSYCMNVSKLPHSTEDERTQLVHEGWVCDNINGEEIFACPQCKAMHNEYAHSPNYYVVKCEKCGLRHLPGRGPKLMSTIKHIMIRKGWAVTDENNPHWLCPQCFHKLGYKQD